MYIHKKCRLSVDSEIVGLRNLQFTELVILNVQTTFLLSYVSFLLAYVLHPMSGTYMFKLSVNVCRMKLIQLN